MYRKEKLERMSLLNKSLAICIFISTALGFYAFFYMTREIFRIFSITYSFDIWILNGAEVKFYNYIYAAFALVLAMGGANRFIAEKPSFHGRSVRWRTSVLNDARVLNAIFLFWVMDLGTKFGFFYMNAQSFYAFSFYQGYKFMFILCILVLYFQQFVTYRKLYPVSTRRFYFLFTPFFLLFVALLGSVNFVDYRKLNERVLSCNPFHSLKIVSPVTAQWEIEPYNSSYHFFLGKPKDSDSTGDLQLWALSEGRIEFVVIDSLVESWMRQPVYSRRRSRCRLSIDQEVNMKVVDDLQRRLSNAGMFRVWYTVNREGEPLLNERRRPYVLPRRLIDHRLIDSLGIHEKFHTSTIELSNDSRNFVFDGELLEACEFNDELQSILGNDSNYIFRLIYEDTVTFQSFINLYSSVLQVINAERHKYALVLYGETFDNLSRWDQEVIRKRYPWNIDIR